MKEPDAMKIAAVQMVSGTELETNLEGGAPPDRHGRGRVGATLVVLPEYFCLMGRRRRPTSSPSPRRPGSGPIQRMLSDAAQEHGVWLIGGTLPMKGSDDSQRVLNSCCVYRARRQPGRALRQDPPVPLRARQRRRA
jgi:predicted amidohydrolase